jgi:hypothetical protein
MYLILSALFTALSVPSLYLGFKLVQHFDLPFLAGFAPIYVCLGIACFFVCRCDADR